ncbi:hypothetical protein N9C84_03960 [Desulfobacterales bacterium]|nr:hypothetical protein [Desulfobacterales bacterium]
MTNSMEKLLLNDDTLSNRNPWSWTLRNKKRAADIISVIDELKRWWPVTERQLYYRLISHNLDAQDHWRWKGKAVDVYRAIGRTLKWMRIDEMIKWNVITDEHRALTPKLGFEDTQDFIEQELCGFLTGYNRCMAQKQERYLELWIEKAALLHIIKPIADSFCRRIVVCRGYNSVTFQANFYTRAQEALGMDQTPTVLYFGDWDPSGVNMIYAAMQTLAEELDLWGVEYYRCGINPDQFKDTPAQPVPIKSNDTRSKRFIEQHGSTAYELDALHPEKLQELARNSIEAFTDMDAYNQNKEKEVDDLGALEVLRDDIQGFAYEEAEARGLI